MTTITETSLPGVLILEPKVWTDERGFFYEAFNEETFASLAGHDLPTTFCQVNHSRSAPNVLRGLHYQRHQPQGKLVTCIQGAIFDVAVDIRTGSPTFGRSVGVVLDSETPTFLWIPPGFAHGFSVVRGPADVVYMCTNLYLASDERGVLWSDPGLDIPWPSHTPVVSRKDAALPTLKAIGGDLPLWTP